MTAPWNGTVIAIFPSAGDFSPGYDPKKSGAKALTRDDVAKLVAIARDERTQGKLAVVAFAIACGAELSALARARRCDISWCHEDPGRSVVHLRGTKNEHRDRLVPIATLEQALLLDYAIRHRDVVARFGRFPHRNQIFGRPSTEAELAFLAQPGSRF